MQLSILIPSTYNRKEMLDGLLDHLNYQIKQCLASGMVEILTDIDGGELSVGEKRNRLLMAAKGEYLVFIDSDDRVSDNYIRLLLKAIQTNPDCCSLNGIITTDGVNHKKFMHYLECESYYEKDNEYHRFPNHLNMIRSSIAKQILFPEINHGEDTEWATKLKKSGLLKTEYKIDEILYFYDYKRNK